VRLKAIAFERCLSKLKMATPLMLGNNAPQPFFDKSLKGSTLAVGQLPGFFEKPIWNLYGCLHVVNHIILYGKMST
jgi:hypothetical protein